MKGILIKNFPLHMSRFYEVVLTLKSFYNFFSNTSCAVFAS